MCVKPKSVYIFHKDEEDAMKQLLNDYDDTIRRMSISYANRHKYAAFYIYSDGSVGWCSGYSPDDVVDRIRKCDLPVEHILTLQDVVTKITITPDDLMSIL